MELFLQNFANLDSFLEIYPLLRQGLELTVLLSMVALPLALLSGLIVAIGYSFSGPIGRQLIVLLIDFLRSFPVLVLLVFIYYSLPFFGLELSGFVSVVTALVLNNTGYYGEIFRAGLQSVPDGQRQAAAALGFHRLPAMIYLILPQAVRRVIAPLATNSLELVKMTPIAALVALPELLRSARVAQEQTYDPTPLTAVAVIFFVLLWPFSRWVSRLEKRAVMART